MNVASTGRASLANSGTNELTISRRQGGPLLPVLNNAPPKQFVLKMKLNKGINFEVVDDTTHKNIPRYVSLASSD
jgi:hypothetical protein